ncbi:pimeloyl-ACP methyl ester carboxylesterase [Saccharomonospora amisosensis]|uniref:Pimeloyl-ACP methyl ester carboxylesterase n=1 Tax=Saccharomonospora amisosensis TaxID=1128677 RepID=A0A7X5URM1_9PSEU|nr:alpha/beta fold hydrolase [Saccharomonospora amisosensis]NIJ12936.1 pimeloyl-ACP methyl ester carboxylesterase [Saccharomonospora amisosensis]
MRTTSLAAVVALTAGIVLAAPVSAGGEPSGPDNVCIPSVPETDVLEPGPVDICVSVFKPADASRDNRVPVLLHSHGWGGSRTSAPGSFQRYLDAGFGVVSIDQRGFGESGGKAHVEDPAFEGADVIAVVDYVASLDWVKRDGPDDPVLGAIGGSYGGGYQFVGAFTELMLTGRTRFDALAPQITWYSLNESLAPSDVVRTAWTGLLYTAGLDAHTSTVHTGFAEGMATGDWPASMAEFFGDNGPAFHVEQGGKLDIPVLLRQGISDNLFPLDQAIKNFDTALTDRARRDSLLIGYNGGHALPNVLPVGTAVSGDACSARLSGAGYDELELRFFAENLLGAPRELTGHGRYHLMTARGDCLSVDSVAPTARYSLPDITTTTAAGVPQAIKIADGPLTIAGTSRLDALVTALGVDSRAFFALSAGTSPLDARVIQNNVLPHREESLNLGTRRQIELPSVAATVKEGESLFLTVSPTSDMFALHGSRTPGAMVLKDVAVNLPVVS